MNTNRITIKKRQLYQYNSNTSILNGAKYEVVSACNHWTVLQGISSEYKKVPHYNLPFRIKTADLMKGIESNIYTLIN